MAVKIRLARHGAKKRPYYRIVVADSRMPRDGRFIEQVGRYDPIPDPHVIEVNLERVDEWIAKGAEPTNAVTHLIEIARTNPLARNGAEKASEPKTPEPVSETAPVSETSESVVGESA